MAATISISLPPLDGEAQCIMGGPFIDVYAAVSINNVTYNKYWDSHVRHNVLMEGTCNVAETQLKHGLC